MSAVEAFPPSECDDRRSEDAVLNQYHGAAPSTNWAIRSGEKPWDRCLWQGEIWGAPHCRFCLPPLPLVVTGCHAPPAIKPQSLHARRRGISTCIAYFHFLIFVLLECALFSFADGMHELESENILLSSLPNKLNRSNLPRMRLPVTKSPLRF